jgi:hypothetical protein
MAGPRDQAADEPRAADLADDAYPEPPDPAEVEAAREAAARKKEERAEKRRATVRTVRTRVAQVVWVVSVVFALVLALGALCVALKANPDNALVSFLLKSADKLDFGVFARTKDGVYHAVGNTHAAHTKNAIVNWGLAALVWLVGGQIVSRIIKP